MGIYNGDLTQGAILQYMLLLAVSYGSLIVNLSKVAATLGSLVTMLHLELFVLFLW